MHRILSGMQPTGNLHLGNYLGALKNWVKLQDSHECFYCIVDLHALTVPQDPAKLKQATRETAAAYIAAGIDTRKSTLFVQGSVSAHTELGWILSCMTPLGWLDRMTQFKEKSGKNRDHQLLGLYAYPSLMAADILVYKATHVPVGEDQKQHLELARDLAGTFNRRYNVEYFPLPEPQILGEATRVMSLRDGTKKMSKSDESDYSRINLTDDADAIKLKFQKAKTDPQPFPQTWEELESNSKSAAELLYGESRPEIKNLIRIYASLADKTPKDVVKEYAGAQLSKFKAALTDVAVAKIGPITARMRELLANPVEIDQILIRGSEHANALSQKHMREIREIVGLWSV